MSEQTILEALLIMAYNVGREHGARATQGNERGFTLEYGRKVVSEQLPKLVAHLDHGALDHPASELVR